MAIDIVPARSGFRVGRLTMGASGIVGATLLAGRVTGLLREIELAGTFGVSESADIAVILLTLPDLLVNLLLSGGISAALIPRLRALPLAESIQFFRKVIWWVLLVFAVPAAAVVMAPSYLLGVFAPGLSLNSLAPLTTLAIAVAIPLTAASGVTSAGLNARGQFFVAGCGTLFFNTVIITTIWINASSSVDPHAMLAVGVLIGALIRLATQVASLPKAWLVGESCLKLPDSAFLKGFMSAVVSTSMALLVPVVIRALVSIGQPGAIASLNYALKLVEVPVGVFITSVSTVALTQLSVHHGRGEVQEARRIRDQGVRKAVINALAAASLLAYFAESIVGLLYSGGPMNAHSLDRVATLTRVLLVGLPFLAISSISSAELYARSKHSVVMRGTTMSLLLFPVFLMPGVLKASERMLAFAAVLFQATLALILARSAGLFNDRRSTWLDRTFLTQLVVLTSVLGGVSILDHSFNWSNQNQRLLIAAISGTVCLGLIRAIEGLLISPKVSPV
jgi:putative peptidoglycan lipid II flippase